MFELRSCSHLSDDQRAALVAAAAVLDELETLHGREGAVLYDSCDQAYFGLDAAAEALRHIAGLEVMKAA